MISMRKITGLVSAGLAAMILTFSVAAQDKAPASGSDSAGTKQKAERHYRREGFRDRERMHRRGHAPGMIRGLRALDLTDDQKAQIKTLMESHRTANEPNREEMKSLMMKRREGTFTDADKARMEELHQSMKASADQLRTTVLGLLTPEQTQKLEQMKLERQQRMQERKERMLERREQMKQKRQELKDSKPDNPQVQ